MFLCFLCFVSWVWWLALPWLAIILLNVCFNWTKASGTPSLQHYLMLKKIVTTVIWRQESWGNGFLYFSNCYYRGSKYLWREIGEFGNSQNSDDLRLTRRIWGAFGRPSGLSAQFLISTQVKISFSGMEPPQGALCWQQGTCLGFCLPLSLSLPLLHSPMCKHLHPLSRQIILKKKNRDRDCIIIRSTSIFIYFTNFKLF